MKYAYQIQIWFTLAVTLLACQRIASAQHSTQSTTAETTAQKTTETNGQSHHSPDTPDHAAPAEVAANKSSKYVIPDVPHGWNEFDNRWFSMTLGFAPIVDYTGFIQDNDSITQVSKQDSRWDIRSGRFSFRGQIHTRRPISYFLSLEYKGLDRPPEAPNFGITDFWFSIPLHKKVGTLTFGKIKETFVYEMVGDAAKEVIARYSHLDLNDRGIRGGILHKGLVGLNRWASRQWRISFAYGLADLERKNISGLTNIFQTRFQWIF